MFSSEKRMITTVIIMCLILGLFGYLWKQRTHVPFVTTTIESITTPFTYGTAKSLEGMSTGIAVLDQWINEAATIDSLKEEKAALLQKQATYDELVAENIRLRQLLQFKSDQTLFDMEAAHVITRDMGAFTDTFTIDKGSADGMAVNMPIVVPSGVVGYISDVYEHSSRVQTILDPRSATGVIVQRPESRVAAILKGNGNRPSEPQMVNIARDSDVLNGDTLVTSGYGGIYPKGILVGHVLSLTNDEEGFVKTATVQPAVNFKTLEEVFVIVRSRASEPGKAELTPKLIPQTQRDEVQGAKGAMQQ